MLEKGDVLVLSAPPGLEVNTQDFQANFTGLQYLAEESAKEYSFPMKMTKSSITKKTTVQSRGGEPAALLRQL